MSLLFNLISVLVSVVLIEAVKFRCDYTFCSIGWYKYYEIPATWRDARLRCHLQGAVLASPVTKAIKNIMVQSITDKSKLFTGMHDSYTKGSYYAIDGKALEDIPHKWAPGEPNNKHNAESCLAINSDGQLSDENCNEPRPYVCFRQFTQEDANMCGTPDSEYQFEPRTSRCYKFHTKPRTFKRAYFTCAAEGGHLAIVNSDTESKVLQELFARYYGGKMLGNFWKDVAFVGFHNWGESTDWTTVHGQSLQDAGFAKFSPGEPNNSTEGEYCGSIYRNGLFNDVWCEKHVAFICEKKPDYPAVCDNESFDLDIRSISEPPRN